MEKNWLIRTKSNHILGPISKNKLTELLQSGSLKPEDEICSGNGFWMFVREKELLEKYVLSDEPQPFNPVSEASSVLTSPIEMDFTEFRSEEEELSLDDDEVEEDFDFEEDSKTSGASEISLPDSEDLSYPELIESVPPDMDLEFSDMAEENTAVDQEMVPQKKKVIRKKPLSALPNEKIKKSWLNDKVLFTMAIVLLVVAIIAFYYRKRIIEKFLDTSAQVEFIETVQAQPLIMSTQKKSLNSLS